MIDTSKMNSTEAIYLFCGWLTSRPEVTEMGSTKDCAPIPPLIEEFCKANNLPPITSNYPYKSESSFDEADQHGGL